MRRKPKSISKTLPPLKVYLDEIEDLYNLLKGVFQGVTVEIDEYEMSDLEGLKDIQAEHIHHLVLRGHTTFESYISVDLLKSSAHLYANQDTIQNLGLLTKIEAILEKCHRRIASIFTNSFATAIIGALILWPPAFFLLDYGTGLIRLLVLPILALATWFYIWSFRFTMRQYSTIILSKRG